MGEDDESFSIISASDLPSVGTGADGGGGSGSSCSVIGGGGGGGVGVEESSAIRDGDEFGERVK